MFVDVAEDKIARGAYNHGITGLKPTPVLHFSKVQLPVVRAIVLHSKVYLKMLTCLQVCCVALNRQPVGSALSSFEVRALLNCHSSALLTPFLQTNVASVPGISYGRFGNMYARFLPRHAFPFAHQHYQVTRMSSFFMN
jgi:hypothetical protein